MNKLFRHDGVGVRSILALGLIAVIAVSMLALTFFRWRRNNPVITSDLIGERLEYVQDLVGVEYYYKDVSSIERSRFQVLGINIPFTGNRAILSYEGVIKYGIDVSQVETNVSGSTVTLTIPESKIISHEIPEKNIEIFDEGKNVFNPITIGDYVDFQAERKSEMEQRAFEKGFPAMAQAKAGESLSAILNAMPGMDNYTLEIKFM